MSDPYANGKLFRYTVRIPPAKLDDPVKNEQREVLVEDLFKALVDTVLPLPPWKVPPAAFRIVYGIDPPKPPSR